VVPRPVAPEAAGGVDLALTGEATLAPLRPEWSHGGLSTAEVEERLAKGLSNQVEGGTSQSWLQILRRNGLTRINFLLLVLGGATLATGSGPDATFLAVAVINTVVGAVQEARAKRTLDALAVINSPQARVVRDGQVGQIRPDDVVVDDLLDLRPGDQCIVDAEVVSDEAEMDESLATGESDPVAKAAGDHLVSGSWVVAGALKARATGVGSDSFANRLAEQARRFSLADSELMRGINLLLKWLSWIMVVVGPVLLIRELQSVRWEIAVRLTVAGLIGMVPEGLVLLTSLAFLAAAVRLGRRQVLVQEMPAVETLARVDSLCVDKTGTLTEPGITFSRMEVRGALRPDVTSALAGLGAAPGANATMAAILGAVEGADPWSAQERVPFSSARKWSAASFDGHGSWVLGAPEVVRAGDPSGLRAQASEWAEQGARVLVLATGPGPLAGNDLPADLAVVAVIELRERIRAAVTGTLAYFAEQGVDVRVISGDNPITVSSVAGRAGLTGADLAVDARGLPADPADLAESLESNRVFGRVTPEQKRAMVDALQSRGHTVAMTGDGVNDALALKDADLGVAMGSGSAVARGVAQVVLLDDDFNVLPSVVAEGRRVLANIESVAVLFLVKNVYSLVLSVAIAITGWSYPFLPRHLSLVSAVGIGIPGFFLALAPNNRRFRPGFLRRALSQAVVAGLLTATAVMLTYAGARQEGLSGAQSRTAAVIVTMVMTLWVLSIAARPLTPQRLLLIVSMAGLFVGAYFIPGISAFFSLDHRPDAEVTVQALVFGAMAGGVLELVRRTGPFRRFADLDEPAPGAGPEA
jgi:cation-transporting P-type ATPase E